MSTRIEWTDETWNPVTGCTKVSEACANCYAEVMHRRFYPQTPFSNVACRRDRLDTPLHWRKPRKVFLCSMGDLFHDAVPDEFLFRVFDTIRVCFAEQRGHVFQILTKRAERMRDFCTRLRFDSDGAGRLYLDDPGKVTGYCLMPQKGCGGLGNVWLGVTAENQRRADERILLLLQTPAAKRFVSVEPMLGSVDLKRIGKTGCGDDVDCLTGWRTSYGHKPHDGSQCAINVMIERSSQRLDWVIAGGETGPHARPSHPEWFRLLRDQCRNAAVPFFFKQWGEHDVTMGRVGKKAAGCLLDGREWKQFPQAEKTA